MRYFATPSTQRVRDAMTAGHLGMIATPMQGNRILDGVEWAADNGCGPGRTGVARGYPGDEAWWIWLKSRTPEQVARCAFAVAPDVLCDAMATLDRSLPWLPKIRSLGYSAAVVAQNGLEDLIVPWDAFDVLFLGGDTEWKLGRAARVLTAEARRLGKGVHMGRVNSEKRYRYAHAIGCTSVDGTYLTYGPDVNLPSLLAWTRGATEPLFAEVPL